MTAHVDTTIGNLVSLTEGLMSEVRAIADGVRDTINAMRSVTSDAVSRMNGGAETLFLAADEFTKAGQSVAGVFQQASHVSDKLAEAADSVAVSSSTLRSVVADYATTRETLGAMVVDLRSTVENARREASLTSDILARIESASQKLGQAQKDAEDYLAGISKVLVETHGEFAENLTKILDESYRDFYAGLSKATSLLRTAVEELAAVVEQIPVARVA
jgi:ABC-type transporter Mla subunit MlaD